MRNRQLVIDSIYYTIGEILPRVIGFFLLPILTKYLTPAEYGIYSYTNVVMLFSFALATLGLNTFLLRSYYKEDGVPAKKKLIGNVFLLTLATNGVVAGLELSIFPGALRLLAVGIPFYPYFLLAIGINFLEGLSVVPLIIYRVRKQARLFVAVNASRTFLQFFAILFLLSRQHLGLTGVYVARLLVNIPYGILFVVVVFRNAVFLPDRRQIRKALVFSLPLLPGVLSYLFISTFDRLVLEKNLGLTSLGLYSTAATFSLALNVVVQGLYRSFEQTVFENHGSNNYPAITDTLYRYFLGCLIAAGFLLGLFSREIFLFLTSARYFSAYALVPLLVIPVILSGLATFLGSLVIAEHRQTVVTRATLLSAAVMIPGTLILVRLIGVYGAILASGLSFAVVVGYYLRDLRLKNTYFGRWMTMLALMLALTLGVDAIGMPLVWGIALKLAVAAIYLAACVLVFRLRWRATE